MRRTHTFPFFCCAAFVWASCQESHEVVVTIILQCATHASLHPLRCVLIRSPPWSSHFSHIARSTETVKNSPRLSSDSSHADAAAMSSMKRALIHMSTHRQSPSTERQRTSQHLSPSSCPPAQVREALPPLVEDSSIWAASSVHGLQARKRLHRKDVHEDRMCLSLPSPFGARWASEIIACFRKETKACLSHNLA